MNTYSVQVGLVGYCSLTTQASSRKEAIQNFINGDNVTEEIDEVEADCRHLNKRWLGDDVALDEGVEPDEEEEEEEEEEEDDEDEDEPGKRWLVKVFADYFVYADNEEDALESAHDEYRDAAGSSAFVDLSVEEAPEEALTLVKSEKENTSQAT